MILDRIKTWKEGGRQREREGEGETEREKERERERYFIVWVSRRHR